MHPKINYNKHNYIYFIIRLYFITFALLYYSLTFIYIIRIYIIHVV